MNKLKDIYKVTPSDLIITSQAFGLLRKGIYENMGSKKAKAFLLRFGKELGSNKAMELMKYNPSLESLLNIAPLLHISLGHVSDVEHNGHPLVIENGNYLFEDEVYGNWINSFEANLHLEHHGIAEECSCHTLSGYASGYLSTILNKDIFVKEVSCRAKGDDECSFKINTKEFWLEQPSDDLAIYDDQTIINELEVTYDKLLSQKVLLDKIAYYHSQLTDCVAEKNDIEHVVQTASQIVNIPIVIEDLSENIIMLTGMELDTYQELIMRNKNRKKTMNTNRKTTYKKIGQTALLTTPIYLDNKIFAFCSFIYLNSQKSDENDYLFLERLSTIATLCFLNEKISFETTEHLKFSILDQLINKQYSTIKEINSQLKYVTSNHHEQFVTLSIKCNPNKVNQSYIDIYDQLLQWSKLLKTYHLECLLSQYKDNIIILLFTSEKSSTLINKIKHVLSHMGKINRDIDYKIGVSQLYHDLNEFDIYLKQAEQAVNLPRQQTIIQFEELGVLGELLQGSNVENLKQMAKKELGKLLESNEKNKELLFTLYTFLGNGGKLEKTRQDLSLSMGGVQYRIRKIENIIQKNLNDFKIVSYLLLLIESLILVGEIKFD
ncbi:V4R domain-containing protein [Niallia sp. XMNu-256]|uniref:V4R domain-containing protein n=1 Tax=Niallia sp. XMNu-256 TaxID=3082444 RepID=UPI0030CCE252